MMTLPPILLHYYITLQCNCRCAFCDIHQSGADSAIPFADPRQVQHNLEQARKMHIPFVDFTGGEPLLHPHIDELLAQAKKLHFHTSITTNCLLYPQKGRSLLGLVDFLHFSLDALDETRHNALRGKAVYAAVMQSIDLARELGEIPDLLYTVTNDNIDELDPLAEFARQCGLILLINPVFNRPVLTASNLHRLVKYQHHPHVYLNQAFLRLRKLGGNSINNPRCRAVSSTLVISPDNYILLPCYHFRQEKIPVPASFKEIFKNKTWQEYHSRQGRFNFCDGCAINCYFDPSFLYKPDIYMFESLAAKARYARRKYFNNKRNRAAKYSNHESAAEIAQRINN